MCLSVGAKTALFNQHHTIRSVMQYQPISQNSYNQHQPVDQ